MADEDVTLDGKSLQSLRVADLKAALECRHLPKSGAKNALIKRLKGALMLENVKKTSTSHVGLQPNSQIGEEMSQNSFIKQYLAQQQELLRQRLEREAREAAEADAGETGPEEEEEEYTEQGNVSPSYHPDKHRPMPSQPPLTRAEEEGGGPMMSQGMGKGMMTRRPGPGSVPQESSDAPGGPGAWMQQRPSPPRAVASLSVRVLGNPEHQGLPPSMPLHAQEKEGTAPADDDRPAHYVLQPSRSARAADSAGGNRVQEDSDDDDDDSSEEDEDEWGPAAGARRGGRSPPPQQPSPSVPAGRERSRRKLQPPQHIPPQQVAHQPPMQLRQPTPPPSPPPELSFPLPDTPKQSPPDMDEEPEGAGAGVAVRSPLGGLQRRDSDSSSRSSSPEPLAQRRPGPLSLLARKMASEGAFGKRGEGASASQTNPGGESSGPGDGGSSIPRAGPGVGVVTHIGGSSSAAYSRSAPAPMTMFGSGAQSHPLSLVSGAAVPSITRTAEPQGPSGETAQKRTQEEKKQAEEREMKQQQAEEERKMKQQQAEEERKMKKQAEEERKMKKQAEEERKMKQQAEEERKMKQQAEEERKMKQQAEEERKMKQQQQAEEERKMKQQQQAEEERKMKQQQAEEERKMKQQAEEERKKQEEEEERKQQQAEEERKQQQAEEERKMKQQQAEEERKMKQQQQAEEERKMKQQQVEEERKMKQQQAEEEERKMKQQQAEEERKMKQSEKQEVNERESCQLPWKHRRDLTSPAASSQFGSGGSEVPALNLGDRPKKSLFGRDEPLSSPPGSTTSLPAVAPKKPRMFSDTSSGSMASPPKLGQQGSVVMTTPGGPPEPHGISVKPLKHGVLVSGAEQHTSPNKASVEKPGSKTGGDDGKMEKERDSQAEKGTPKAGETRRRGPEEAVEVEPMGPVLPPSYPGKREEEKKRKEDERNKEDERRRKRKRVSDRRSSPSSDGDSSSNDSNSGSSSSRSTSSRDKKKKSGPGKGREDEKRRLEKGREKRQPSREEKQSSLSEPSGHGPMEVEERPDPEDSRAPQPIPEVHPENSEGCIEESTIPKALTARKISLTTGSKTSSEGAAAGEAESGTAAGRKRRWGSSTAVNAKKPSISITTDSLKSLIPDIKPSQEAVVDLHPDDIQLSGDEDTSSSATREDQGLDKDLKIRRTVTQVVPGESHENGQGEREEEEEEEEKQERDGEWSQKEKRKNSYSEDPMESQSSTTHDANAKKVTPSDTLVRRSISQQKSGVSVTIDDPVRTDKQPSPPRGKVSNIVHICNLVRPFTLGQLKELLNRTGAVVEEGFWIDKIKSHCYVTYSSTEEAMATRAALHGVKWPQSNPKVLSVDFCEQNELDFHRGLLTVDPREEHRPQPAVGPGGPKVRLGGLPPLMPERDGRGDRGVIGGVRDQWAEREREMERRERTRAEREWDRDKVRDFGGKPGEERERGRRSRSLDRERRRKEREGKERKTDKKDEPPAKLLDDLFNKTKAAPCIYWLPLTEEQATQRGKEREERQKEREKRRKEQQQEEDKKREEERKQRIKSREEGGAAVSTGGGSVRGSEGDRERGRDREGDKRKDSGGFKPRGPDAKPLSGFRRSRSRSDLRDRHR